MYDKGKFAELLIKSQGNRSLNSFARDSGVSSAYISKLIRGKYPTAPSPAIIKKIADAAKEVSYGELMVAAGHILSLEDSEKMRAKRMYLLKENPHYLALHPDLEERYKSLTEEEKKELDDFIADSTQEELNDFILSIDNNYRDLSILLQGEIEASMLLKEPEEIYFNDSPKFVKIPILGKIACGDPILAIENIDGYRYELEDNLPSGELFELVAKGKSMEPTIPDGCFVLVRQQSDVENGEIAAIRINNNDEATLKRVKKQNNIIMLIPDNKDFEPIVVTEENPITILGKAMRFTVDL